MCIFTKILSLRLIRCVLLFSFWVFCFWPNTASGQFWKKDRNDTIRKSSFLALPVAFYSPETRWGFGGFGMYSFYPSKKDTISPPSLIQFGAAYTQNKQVLTYAPYDIYLNEDNLRINGEIGYYIYSYDFFGVGPDLDLNYSETYELNYPRLRVHVNQRVGKNFLVGGQFWFENMKINQSTLDPEGLLASGRVEGSLGGVTSGIGALLTFDTRDNVHYPSKGWFIKGTAHTNSRLTGSDYAFDRYRIDLRKYISLNDKNIFANQLFLDHITGAAPFTQMAFFGGTKRARGYYLGRFRDKNMLLFQTEYRAVVYKSIGAVAFFNYGSVAPELSKLAFNDGRYSYGLGLRYTFDPKKKVNVRLDAAFGPGTSGFYFTFGEAF